MSSCIIIKTFAVSLFALVCVFNAQEIAEDDGGLAEQQGQSAEKSKEGSDNVIDVDGQKVVNGWLGQEKLVFGADGSGRWRYFMHGLTDEHARPFSWNTVFPGAYRKYAHSKRVSNDVKSSELYSLCLKGGDVITSEMPVIDLAELNGRNGSTYRLHVWISGEKTGEGGTLWESAPQVTLVLRDGAAQEVVSSTGLFRTRGTYPWFCYYVDITIPREFNATENAGVYVRLSNPQSGLAWFCTPSFELLNKKLVDEVSGQLDSALADPKRGTFAPNPDYDEMPMNFFLGLPEYDSCVWRFIDGNAQNPSIILSYDMETYLKRYSNDWFHWVHGVPYLLQLYTVGLPAKRSPQLQPDWNRRLVATLRAMQDSRTGLWKVGNTGNLMATYLIASRCFSPALQLRADKGESRTAWTAVEGGTLPHADALARSILAEQNKQKNGEFAGWNKYAFQGKDLVNASRDAVLFDMESSAAAVSLLSQCRPLVSQTLRSDIDKAVRGAYEYAIAHVLGTTGLFYTDERQTVLGLSPMTYVFLEGTSAMEMKRNAASVPMPVVQPVFAKDGAVALTLGTVPSEAASIRVYGLLADQDEKTLTDSMLLAIVKNVKAGQGHADPLAVLKTFNLKRSHAVPACDADSAGAAYVSGKVKALDDVSVMSGAQGGKVTVEVPRIFKKGKLLVMSSDAYGNLSKAQTIDIP